MRQLEIEDLMYKKNKFELVLNDIAELLPEGSTKEDVTIFVTSVDWKRVPLVSCAAMVSKSFGTNPKTAMPKAIDAIIRLSEAELYRLIRVKETILVESLIELSTEVKKRLKQLHFLPPMVSRPNPVKRNNDSPYYSIGKESLILGDWFNYHDDNIGLDVINIQNNVKLSYVGEENEISKLMPECFYFSHKVDKRGRLYCCGFDINYQGTDVQKASVEFYEKEVIKP